MEKENPAARESVQQIVAVETAKRLGSDVAGVISCQTIQDSIVGI